MYKSERLKIKKLPSLMAINDKRLDFNSLNEDFIESYYSMYKNTILKKLLLISNVKIINYKNETVGYIWYEKLQNKHLIIKCISFIEKTHYLEGTKEFLANFRPNYILSYNCDKNTFNYNILEELGFMKDQATLELIREIKSLENINIKENITFEKFIKGKHEKLRCQIQNLIFQNNSREPLTLEDIQFDIQQDYYIEDGAVFLKYKDEYIGYGQIIFDHETPTIVNFGIIEEHRNKGYGNILMKYIINLVCSMNYFKVKIKVYSENNRAIKLYLSNGFKKINEYCLWNYLT